MSHFIVVYFLGIMLITSCKNADKTFLKDSPESLAKTAIQPLSGNADAEAKISATILVIYETRDTSDRQSACFKAPCYAQIRINKIERKGKLFSAPEQPLINAFFIYTLHPTSEDLFPNMGKWFPGLKINDNFEAIIASRPEFNEEIKYIIYDYRKIN